MDASWRMVALARFSLVLTGIIIAINCKHTEPSIMGTQLASKSLMSIVTYMSEFGWC